MLVILTMEMLLLLVCDAWDFMNIYILKIHIHMDTLLCALSPLPYTAPVSFNAPHWIPHTYAEEGILILLSY